MSEIYALEHLYNNAINDVDVTMGGKTIELDQIVQHLRWKLDRLYEQLENAEEEGGATGVALTGKLTMTYTPLTEPQKVDVRRAERYTGSGTYRLREE